MRMKLPARLEHVIHRLAITQNRSQQAVAERLLDAGLAATTGTPRVDDLHAVLGTVQKVAADVNVIADALARHKQSIADAELRRFIGDVEATCRKAGAEFSAAIEPRA